MYELHNLGWRGFQQLCLTITREILGQTVESFLDSNDGGRDGAFAGTWTAIGTESMRGRFVIQCKFTNKSNRTLELADLSDELAKTKRLVKRGHCDVYVLLTNAKVSGTKAEKVEKLFEGAGAKQVLVLGPTWVADQIRESKRLRMLVPRIYGLGDLSQILDERAYSQAKAVLASLREELAKTVVTAAYTRAVEALEDHGFVLLVGEPAAGKTTIASLLSMAAIDQWNASLLKLSTPNKMMEHWNPDEPSQFFWLDDAFGVAQYENFLVQGWNHVLPHLPAMLRSGAKIVMTSRDYIYNSARNDLKEGAFPLLRESQVVIDVHDLSADERQQILYNHLRLGKQPQTFRTTIKPHLEAVASHPRFIPETARRLADPVFTKGLYIDDYYLGQFVEKREQLLQEVVKGLDSDSKAALALIYMRNDRLESPVSLQPSEEQAIARLSSTIGRCVVALNALSGSLVQSFYDEGQSFWRFKHPTIGDAYASLLVLNPELLGVYVQGTEPEKLVQQVTCGDVGIERAVVIPKSLYGLTLERLERFTSSAYKDPWLADWGTQRGIQGFLTRRCSKEFLALYLARNPKLLDQVADPGLFLDSVPEVRLAIRLHEFGLLPEAHRKRFLTTVSEYALEGQDLYALDDSDIRQVFTDDEFEKFLSEVRKKLVPRLDDVRQDWQGNHPSDQPPDGYIQPLLDGFRALKRHFADNRAIIKAIDRVSERVAEWVNEHIHDEPKRPPRQKLGKVTASDQPRGERSIFDDVDS